MIERKIEERKILVILDILRRITVIRQKDILRRITVIDRQTDRQTDRQIDREREREKES